MPIKPDAPVTTNLIATLPFCYAFTDIAAGVMLKAALLPR
jgi:hypothetical protein